MIDPVSATLQQQWYDERIAPPTFDGVQLGVIHTVSDGTCKVVIPDFDPTITFGPAPYPQGTSPTAGDPCAVAFVGPGTSQPIVIALLST